LPVVFGTSLLVFAVDAHVVAEQAVHAHVREPALLVDVSELALPVGTQAFGNPPRPDAGLEHRVQRALDPAYVGGDDTLRRGR
jgi:hypothetical protein